MSAAAALLGLASAGCHDEPIIVIHFTPQDLSLAARAPSTSAAASNDAGATDKAKVAAPAVQDPAAQRPAAATPASESSKEKAPAGAPHEPAAAAAGAECRSDGECVAIRGDCCGCSAGGTAKAVPRTKQRQMERSEEKRCGLTACPAVISTDPSCRKRPACRHGRCELVE